MTNGEPRSGTSALVAALEAHGLAAAAAAQLRRRHTRQLVTLTRRTNREHAVMLDAESGEQVGELLVGERMSIDLGAHLRAMQPGREYVAVHTHPSDCSFSRDDAMLLFVRPGIRAMVVLGARGSAYLLSRLLPGALPSSDLLVAAHRLASEQHQREYDRVVAAGTMSRRAARCARAHAVWLTIAPQCGLRYTRVERGHRREDHGD